MAEPKYTTVAEVLAAYDLGERQFTDVDIEGADFSGHHLKDAWFQDSSLRTATFARAYLHQVHFIHCDLTGADFGDTQMSGARLHTVDLSQAGLVNAFLGAAMLSNVTATGADLTGCGLIATHLLMVKLTDATLDDVSLGGTMFTDVDLFPFCDTARLRHGGPSYVGFRSVMRSYRHPGLKQFLVDCGVPPMVAEYTIDAARAEGEGALESLMRSTFISYGGPDEPFARRLYEALRAKHVTTFFFPETARLGRRIGDEVHSRIQEHDRVIVVCSRDSLDRPGVRNEIQETFDREARDGGATYLLPIMLDDYVLTDWQDPLAGRVRDRVVGDFRDAMDDDTKFEAAMSRLLAALRKEPPSEISRRV